ncbi:MAG: alpha/beta hydrolase [Candidatus Omnitrophica bacterium]|nr:alpha/beta hydrolase [Candidatus Omnitrophota bacterium]
MLELISNSELEELNSKPEFFTKGDGRRIAFYEYGAADGIPIFFCHGSGSHIHVALLHKPAKRLGYRVITPDRPGIGLSGFDPKRKILDSASDIALIADHLGIKRFGVMGISGGNPTLLACAYKFAERLMFVVDLAGAAPLYTDPQALKQIGTMDRLFAKLGTHMPLSLFKIPFSILGFQQKNLKNPKAFVKMMGSSFCQADRKLFEMPELQYLFMRDFQELFRQGSRGAALDAQLIYLPWGFDVHRINIHVDIRQGTDDRWVPPSFSQYLAKTLPLATLKMLPGQGHFYHLAYGEETLKMLKPA